MSTPRPAMLVETVTAPRVAGPGDDRGFRLLVARVEDVMRDGSARLSRSDSSTLAVPTRTGRPVACSREISSTTAASFSALVGNTASGSSSRATGRFVGMVSTSSS